MNGTRVDRLGFFCTQKPKANLCGVSLRATIVLSRRQAVGVLQSFAAVPLPQVFVYNSVSCQPYFEAYVIALWYEETARTQSAAKLITDHIVSISGINN